jgi:hypothetical protein
VTSRSGRSLHAKEEEENDDRSGTILGGIFLFIRDIPNRYLLGVASASSTLII